MTALSHRCCSGRGSCFRHRISLRSSNIFAARFFRESSTERVAAVKAAAAGGGIPFVYYVSTTGVTGAAGVDASGASDRAAGLRAELGLPVIVGFGIDSGDKARAAAAHADGAVTGTALVKAIEEGISPPARLAAVERLVLELRAGIDS